MASEVGPAAGTYIKLQEYFFSEEKRIGTEEEIGYRAPGDADSTTNFKYDTSKKGIFTATLLNDLKKCAKGSVWTVTAIPKDGNLQFHVEISGPNPKACEDLTPNFKKLGKF